MRNVLQANAGGCLAAAPAHVCLQCVQGLGARSRRDLLRKTWVPQGKGLKDIEEEKSVVIRFVIGYRCAAAHLFSEPAWHLEGLAHCVCLSSRAWHAGLLLWHDCSCCCIKQHECRP